MNRLVGIILLVGCNSLLYGQTIGKQSKDSLEFLAENTTNARAKVDTYLQLAQKVYTTNPDSTKIWTLKALDLSIINNYKKGQAEAYRMMGLTEEIHGNFDISMEYYSKTIEIAKELEDSALMALAIKNTGNIYRKQTNHQEALKRYEKSMYISKRLGDSLAYSDALINVAIIHKLLGDNPKALTTYQQALLIKEIFLDSTGIAVAYQGIGTLYKELNELDLALDYINKSLTIKLKQNNKLGAAITYGNIGGVLIEMNRYEDALNPLLESLKIKKSLKQTCGLSYPLNSLGKAYYELGKIDTAYFYLNECIDISEECSYFIPFVHSSIYMGKIYQKRNEYDRAEKYLNKAYKVSKKASTKELLEASRELMEFYSSISAFQKAFEFNQIYTAIKDSVFNIENTKKITRLESEFEFEKERNRINAENEMRELALEQKALREKYLGLAGSAILFILLAVSFYNYRIKTNANSLLRAKNFLIQEQADELKKSTENEKQLLNDKIKAQERELTTLAMQSNEKNNILRHLNDKLDSMKFTDANKAQIKELKNIIINNINSDNHWDTFLTKFEAIYPQFFTQLKEEYSSLTLNELKLCGYIKIGMNNNEIMHVANVANSTIKKNLNRLKKKLNLSADDSLRDFIIPFPKSNFS